MVAIQGWLVAIISSSLVHGGFVITSSSAQRQCEKGLVWRQFSKFLAPGADH